MVNGRRGLDREGHIIYGNVNWKKLMKGELSEITSKYENIDNYGVIETISPSFQNHSSVYNNILDSDFNRSNIKIRTDYYNDDTKNILFETTRL